MGVAAPHWIEKPSLNDSISLNSRDPFSLYNAYRYAAGCAERKEGYWGESNWSTFEGRENSILLMNYFYNEIDEFKRKLLEIRPDVLFIGAMTISFAGAIGIAKAAKELLKDDVFIVLGGKHALETVYIKDNELVNDIGSPLRLMKEGTIEKVFDLVISGDGEYTIYNVGNIIGRLVKDKLSLKDFYQYTFLLEEAAGNWVIGWLENNDIMYIKSKGKDINYDEIPITADLFPIRTKFSVFDADLTAHAFSDISKGCVFNCFYCSERNSINGKLKKSNMNTAASRLANYLEHIELVGKKRYGVDKMSVFVEDSIILAGNTKSLEKLNDILTEKKLNIEFGGQFTVDTMLKNKEVIKKLRKNGFNYVFFGIETMNETIAEKMSKNIGTDRATWVDRNEQAIQLLKELDILCGVSVLFGLGETQEDRLKMLGRIKGWMEKYKNLCVVSLNWAVKHPLRGNEDSSNYNYVEWGTDRESEYLEIFTELFGEATEKYCMPGVKLPKIEELEELKDIYDELCLLN